MYAADTDSPASQSKPWFVSEANLPEGFPAAGPVDEVIVKTYPQHRLARVQSDSGTDGMFWKLFNHIKRNDIKMTAPVEMSWTPKAAANPDGTPDGNPNAMAFLYGSSQLGTAGADSEDASVVVEDIPAETVVSIGLRGSYGKKRHFFVGMKNSTHGLPIILNGKLPVGHAHLVTTARWFQAS